MEYEEFTIEGRNSVIEAFRSGKTIDKIFLLDGCQDGPIKTILKEIGYDYPFCSKREIRADVKDRKAPRGYRILCCL